MNQINEHGHEPVMVREVLHWLALEGRKGMGKEGKLVVMDCTVGRGGHVMKIAEVLAGQGGGMIVAMDVDPDNLQYARKRIGAGGFTGVEVRTFHANFGEAGDVLEALGLAGVDGLLADFGVSTNQLLEGKHGLSFNAEKALDMRLDPRIGRKASDLVAELDEKELATILQEYAQERFAWRIARKIVQTRAGEPILTTGQLARLVRSVVPPTPPRGKGGSIDPATRTFQALRMAVNLELESLTDLLNVVPELMNAEGRAVFISFHSGEDRLVKQAARRWEEVDGGGMCEILTKKPEEPGEEETRDNPRSRSAKLRAVRFLKASAAKDGGRARKT